MKSILYSPYLEKYKKPLGAVAENCPLSLTLFITKEFNIWDLKIVIDNDEDDFHYEQYLMQEEDNDYNRYYLSLSLEKWGLYWYHFEFYDCYGRHYISVDGNIDGVLADEIHRFQLSIYQDKERATTKYNGKIIYQIMVDRFCDGGVKNVRDDIVLHKDWHEVPNYLPVDGKILNNDFFGGDLKGLISKLDYLQKLNVGIIYLNPIFKAYSNHKYDTGDYMMIDPMFGTVDDFKRLCKEAKKRGMAIILDGVFNHTGDDSIYFNRYGNYQSVGAFQSPESPYYRWYKFISYPNRYESWWGFQTLPALNDKYQGVIDFFASVDGVVATWLNNGASGFRLDVVDELSNCFLEKIIQRAKQTKKEALMIGEVWEDASNKIAYGKRRSYLNGAQLDSVMNYPLRGAILDFIINHNNCAIRNLMRVLVNNYPKYVLDNLMNILGTHDTVRLLTSFANIDISYLSKKEQADYKMTQNEYYEARQKLKMATALLYTLPGLPTIYYGDEAGMEGFKDPFCRRTMPWDNFDDSIYEWYLLLGDIHKEDVYIDGEYQEDICDKGVFSFKRIKGDQEIITIVNNSYYEYGYFIEEGFDMIEKLFVSKKVIVPKMGVKIIKVTPKRVVTTK